MKKTGFTLAEILVSIAVVAIVAALTVPMIEGLMPDKKKAIVIRTYKTLMDINRELLDDPSLYIADSNTPNQFAPTGHCVGLNCVSIPTSPTYNNNNFQGYKKYPLLLASKLNCKNPPVIDEIGGPFATHIANFDTEDGISWRIRSTIDAAGNDSSLAVIIDINGRDVNSGPNCVYFNENQCPNPDQFMFIIDSATGNLQRADALTQAYLRNMHKLNDRKNDLRVAKEIADQRAAEDGD